MKPSDFTLLYEHNRRFLEKFLVWIIRNYNNDKLLSLDEVDQYCTKEYITLYKLHLLEEKENELV